MRKILFKAKAINRDNGYHRTNYKNGDWVCGLITRLYDERFENLPAEMTDENGVSGIEIDHNTICQYTGLTDKNGNKIWENDVVTFKHEKFDFDDGLEPWERTVLPNKKEYKRNYVVEFCNTPTHYGLRFRNGSIWFMAHRMTVVMHDVKVIGTKFDNPELLGG